MCLLHVEHDARDGRAAAVLGGAYTAYAVAVDFDLPNRLIARSVGEIHQNSIGVNCSVCRGFHWRTEGNLHAQVTVGLRHRYVLNSRGTACALRSGTGQ